MSEARLESDDVQLRRRQRFQKYDFFRRQERRTQEARLAARRMHQGIESQIIGLNKLGVLAFENPSPLFLSHQFNLGTCSEECTSGHHCAICLGKNAAKICACQGELRDMKICNYLSSAKSGR